jgi:RimJ/RimL family protein N-acetyltransferase
VVALITVEGNAASERVAGRAGFVVSETFREDHRGSDMLLSPWTRSRPA